MAESRVKSKMFQPKAGRPRAEKIKKPAKKAVKKVVKKKVVPKKKVLTTKKSSPLQLVRHHSNPVLTPRSDYHFEARATFNPSAVLADGKIHLLYRAVGHDDVSRICYASSSDGCSIYYRHWEPVYNPSLAKRNMRMPKIAYASGGGTAGGCEDPRLTELEGRIYMIYTAFDGWSSLRLAITSIAKEDFLANHWNWRKPVLISPPGQIQKCWTLFPEKINGKYAILTGVSPEVQVTYLNSLDELDGKHFITSKIPVSNPKDKRWDNWMRGVGPSPIKTKLGWLILYHAMDLRDPNRYKMGAMILDSNNPTKIVYRSKEPILEPDMEYENLGFKAGVVYSCGAVVKDKYLIVYYGGADTVVCVAVADYGKFIKEIAEHKPTTLKLPRRKK